MKKLFCLMLALILAMIVLTPALADTAEAVEETAEEAVETVEETVEEAAEEAVETVEEAAEEVAVSPVFKKLLEVPWYTWVVLGVTLVAALMLTLGAKKIKWDTRRLTIGAMCIAIAFVASCIRLFRMPQGGSITPASMLPMIMFMAACGPWQGFVVGCAYGFLQLLSSPSVIHPVQLLMDYPLAYGSMILGCAAMALPIKKPFQLPLAVLLAGIGRLVMATLSGAIFFAEYAGDQNAWVYSLVYNISYLGPDTLVCMVVAAVPGMAQMVDIIRKKD